MVLLHGLGSELKAVKANDSRGGFHFHQVLATMIFFEATCCWQSQKFGSMQISNQFHVILHMQCEGPRDHLQQSFENLIAEEP